MCLSLTICIYLQLITDWCFWWCIRIDCRPRCNGYYGKHFTYIYLKNRLSIAHYFQNWKEMYHPSFQLTFFLIYCGADFYYSCVEYLSEHRDVSHFCHLGGAIAGFLVGIGVLCNFKQRPWKRKLWFGSVALFVLLMSAGVLINIFFFDSFIAISQPTNASNDSTSTVMPAHSILITTIVDDT